MPLLLFVGGLFLIILFIYLSYAAKKRRRMGFIQMARQLNLTYSEEDPFGLLGYPFELFHKGDGRGVENVLHGAWQEVDVVAFDYWYYDESTDPRAAPAARTTGSTACSCRSPADCPRLTIDRENMLSRLADALQLPRHPVRVRGVQPAIHVNCEVPKFANDLDRRADDGVAAAHGIRLRVRGARATASWWPGRRSIRRSSPSSSGWLGGSCSMFRKVVSSLYPG